MKKRIELIVSEVLTKLSKEILNNESFDVSNIQFTVERTKDRNHGDFATNVAMVLAKPVKSPPREIATRFVKCLEEYQFEATDIIQKVEIAGPGFINFFLKQEAHNELVNQIIALDSEYGKSSSGQGQKVLIEFISANPTGPLHVGHGRGAVYGDTLARILRAIGCEVETEYYVNDAGRQMDILAMSVWLRYLQQYKEQNKRSEIHLDDFPQGAYQGEYIIDIATSLGAQYGDQFIRAYEDLSENVESDKDLHLDQLIAYSKMQLGGKDYERVFNHACETIVHDIRDDLSEFDINFNRWFSERSLLDSGDITAAIATLEKNDMIYVKEGAKWFKSTEFGDDKDRVVMRSNGSHTYFASDMAYHYNKGNRGYDQLINIFGADHHGYVKRIKSVFEALGHNQEALEILLVQFAVLYQGGKKLAMSTRSGEFVTLRALREEVGNDSTRFFYVSRKAEQHMDFDLDLAKSQSSDNPVFYIQFAHARICRVFIEAQKQGLTERPDQDKNYTLLTQPDEIEILRLLSRFPESVEYAAMTREAHTITYYLKDLATAFSTYYHAHQFLIDDEELRSARLGLIKAIKIVLNNGLLLLGMNAPEEM